MKIKLEHLPVHPLRSWSGLRDIVGCSNTFSYVERSLRSGTEHRPIYNRSGDTACDFGDSIAWGSGDPEGGGWTNRLKLAFMAQRPADDEPDEYVGVYAFATPGHRVRDVAARVDSDLRAAPPDAVVIAIGTNDVS